VPAILEFGEGEPSVSLFYDLFNIDPLLEYDSAERDNLALRQEIAVLRLKALMFAESASTATANTMTTGLFTPNTQKDLPTSVLALRLRMGSGTA
jgi:hypothetical protein